MSFESDVDNFFNFVIERMALKREIIRLTALVEAAFKEGCIDASFHCYYDTDHPHSDDEAGQSWSQSQAKKQLEGKA